MADLTITAASVIAGASAVIDRTHNAGAAVTAGQTVYLDPADATYKLSDNNSGTAAARVVSGIALNGAASGQPLAVVTNGLVTIGAAVTAGVGYYLSATPGGICPIADLGSGSYPSLIGFAINATQINVAIAPAGVALA